MATGQLNQVLRHLRCAALLRDEGGLTDAQLLERFLKRRDEAALEALVRRHEAMVWGVCRRLLRNYHDAEDAFQATFLVLVRRAAAIVPREMVANWLYGVAYRTALKARATALRRKARESQVTDMPQIETPRPDSWQELQPVLDEELTRLADKYRAPVVLCDLEGKTRKEAAQQLGWPEGTVAGRLARARKLLAQALARRGIALSGGAVALAVAQSAMGAPAALVCSTVKAASLFAVGKAAAGVVTARVAALTEGVLRAMLLNNQKTVLVVVLAALLALGGGTLVWSSRAGENGFAAGHSDPQTAGTKQDNNLKNTLLALDKHLREAAGRGEWREIEKFYAPDYLGVGTVGKSRYAANIEAVKNHRPIGWQIRDVDVVRVGKDAAVLTYIYSCKVVSPDGRLLQTRKNHRATLVWAQRHGGWVLVYGHDEHGRRTLTRADTTTGGQPGPVDVQQQTEFSVPIKQEQTEFSVPIKIEANLLKQLQGTWKAVSFEAGNPLHNGMSLTRNGKRWQWIIANQSLTEENGNLFNCEKFTLPVAAAGQPQPIDIICRLANGQTQTVTGICKLEATKNGSRLTVCTGNPRPVDFGTSGRPERLLIVLVRDKS
jgi:RNA polymerase sigma factor (sigma-70 family)